MNNILNKTWFGGGGGRGGGVGGGRSQDKESQAPTQAKAERIQAKSGRTRFPFSFLRSSCYYLKLSAVLFFLPFFRVLFPSAVFVSVVLCLASFRNLSPDFIISLFRSFLYSWLSSVLSVRLFVCLVFGVISCS